MSELEKLLDEIESQPHQDKETLELATHARAELNLLKDTTERWRTGRNNANTAMLRIHRVVGDA